jgi:hypothetical protein
MDTRLVRDSITGLYSQVPIEDEVEETEVETPPEPVVTQQRGRPKHGTNRRRHT